MFRRSLLIGVACLSFGTHSYAQIADTPPQTREDALDPTPVDPQNDIVVPTFIGDASLATPRTAFHNLVFRDMLTPLQSGDPLRPSAKGAVLQYMKAISQATLASGLSASGSAPDGDRLVFYTAGGSGRLTVNGTDHEIRDGIGFTLTNDFNFTLTNTGSESLLFYVRWESLPDSYELTGDVLLYDRFENDRRVGAHWAHICNGGPNGFNLCTIAPRTIPQPHSHANEEVWIAVKGKTILTLGKYMAEMVPGQAYRVPPTGLVAHSNINLADEPAQLLFVGPAQRASTPTPPARLDFARLDNRPYTKATEPDIDKYIGHWRDAFPRIEHGNLYFRDMLTSLEGEDPLNPKRTGAVLTRAKAISLAQLEPGSIAHRVEGEPTNVQQVFYVASGTGRIRSGDREFEVTQGDTFVLPPAAQFRLVATGERYLNLYVVTEEVAPGGQAATEVFIVNRKTPVTDEAWHQRQQQLLSGAEGMQGYKTLYSVELKPMAMSRPYSVSPGSEEVWIATENETELLLSKELRRLPAGTAYLVPPTGFSAHTQINHSGAPARFLRIVW